MTGPYPNPRRATLFAVFFVHVIIQRIDGFPYDWREFFPIGDLKESVHGGTIEVFGDSFRYGESRVSSNGGNGDSRVEGESQLKWMEGSDEYDDDDSMNENDRIGNTENDGAEDKKTNAKTQFTEDALTQLIEQAVEDHILLSPEEWDKTLTDNQFDIRDNEGMSVKIQKPRSPSDPPKKPTQPAHSNANDRIIFPDNMPRRALDPSTVSVPRCEGSTFCVDASHYPTDSEISETLNKHYIAPITEPPSISERIGPMDENNELCVSQEQTISPKSGLDDTKTWRIIFNNQDYVQTVKVEVCAAPDKACKKIEDLIQGYTSTCKQKYVYRHLVGLGPNGTTLLPIQMPSSCCCQVKVSGDPMVRLGITPDRRKRQSFPPDVNEH